MILQNIYTCRVSRNQASQSIGINVVEVSPNGVWNGECWSHSFQSMCGCSAVYLKLILVVIDAIGLAPQLNRPWPVLKCSSRSVCLLDLTFVCPVCSILWPKCHFMFFIFLVYLAFHVLFAAQLSTFHVRNEPGQVSSPHLLNIVHSQAVWFWGIIQSKSLFF